MKNTLKFAAAGMLGGATMMMAAMISPPGIGGGVPVTTAPQAQIGQPAPNFTLKDHEGKEHTLADYKGKTVILEWFNPECPFVVWHYENREGFLRTMYNDMKAKDSNVVWLLINSGAPGQQGTGLEKNQGYVEKWNLKAPILFDEPGRVGRMYDAKTTPHMYLINPEGVLVYHGALDNAPNGRVRGGGDRVNYLQQAYNQMKAGETVSPAETRPYGCTVKYVN